MDNQNDNQQQGADLSKKSIYKVDNSNGEAERNQSSRSLDEQNRATLENANETFKRQQEQIGKANQSPTPQRGTEG